MISKSLYAELGRIVGPGNVQTGAVTSGTYSYDASLVTASPDAVVLPASTAQVAGVVAAAARAGVPCVARGFGTNLSGGSVPVRGGVVVGLARMNRIVAIQPRRRTATVQSGLTNLELQNALAPMGFFYAPDPASQKVATLGGNVAENSGGPHCLKYGVTTNHVLGLQAVLADGQVVRLGGAAPDTPGYDLRGLFVGSEGTLGIVTEVTVRLMPKPEHVITMLAVYDDVDRAARSVSAIIAAGIVPATLEMMDAVIIRAVEESFPCGYPLDAAAVLIIEVEGPAAGLAQQARCIQDLCMAQGCRSIRQARDAAERDQLWAGRRGAFGAIARIAPNYLVADCTVPRTRLPEALERVAAIAGRHGFASGNVFHAGDGNLHPLLLFDARNSEHLDRVHQAGREIMQACAALGGTITGEHGIGSEKIEAMRMIFSQDDLEFQHALRRAIDPDGRLNPGKVLPELAARPGSPLAPPLEARGDLEPGSVAEARDMVRSAAGQGVCLLPVGGGRRADFGNLPTGQAGLPARPLRRLRTGKLAAIIEYDPPNQFVTAGAGMKLSQLQQTLAANHQWLPLRPPLADGCTLGGMAALGACGPERHRYGAPRDRLLGLRLVAGTGRLIAAGGKVVKNVAGYDVTRLVTGSAGTLGLIVELTFSVLAVPQTCRAATARGTLAQCAAAAADLLQGNLEPTFVTCDADGPPGDDLWRLSVGFEGFDLTVASQIEKCASLLAGANLTAGGQVDYPLYQGLHAARLADLFGHEFLLRADLPSDVLEPFLPLVRQAIDVMGPGDMLADLACGRLWAATDALDLKDWSALREQAAGAGGHAILERAPVEFKRRTDVLGIDPPLVGLMGRIKEALDPHGVFPRALW